MTNKSPFSQVAMKYLEAGISVVPDAPKSKACFIKGWPEYCDKLPTKEQIEIWCKRKDANISVCLGEASNLTALDFDDNIDGLHEKIKELLPEGYCIKKAKKGFTAFFKNNDEKKQVWKKNGVVVVEFVNKTTIPASIHPKGMEYEWVGRDLFSSYLSLPTLPNGFVETLNEIFGVKKYEPRQTNYEYDSPTTDEIKDALSFISPDVPHDDWIKVGMAIYGEVGDEGFSLFDNWSAQSPKYNRREMNSKWKSFRNTEIGIGTLFFIAKQHGYIAPTVEKKDKELIDIDWDGLLEIKKEDTFPEELLNAPRLVGKIKRWLDSVSIKKQPILSLASAVTATGTIMGHRVASDTDLRTNMQCLALAGSGHGKDHARKAIVELYRACKLAGLMRGTPTSGQGLLTALTGSGGCCLMQIDEMGEYLQGIQGSQTPKYLKDIMVYMTTLFSSANSIFYGQEYANKDGKTSRQDIEQPCLNVLGSTSQKTFFDSLTGKETANGFIARWLIFETEKKLPQENKHPKDIKEIPVELIENIREIRSMARNVNPLGDVDDEIRPAKLPFTEEAKDILEKFKEEIDLKRDEFIKNDNPLESIFNRTVEHAIKLSLLASDGKVIDKIAILWGIRVSQYSSNKLAEAIAENVYDNNQEMLVQRVYKTIKAQRGWTLHSSLIRKTQYLKARDRSEIINDLINSDKIESDIERTSRRPVVKYRVKK